MGRAKRRQHDNRHKTTAPAHDHTQQANAKVNKRPQQTAAPATAAPVITPPSKAASHQQPAKKQKLNSGYSSSSPSASSSTPAASDQHEETAATVSPSHRKPVRNTYVPMTDDGQSIAFASDDGDDDNSDAVAARFFQWLIAPLSTASFYSNYFEKRPFAILRSHPASPHTVRIVSTINTVPAQLKARLASSPPPSQPDHSVEQLEEEVEVEVNPSRSSSSASAFHHYYSGWLSKSDVFSLLSSPGSCMRYTQDVDVTQYKDGKRVTLNPPNSPIATAASVRHHFKSGCSVRFLSPQQHSDRIWRLLHLLDSALGMQAGANSYLTPAGTQGFSPHYDDVDIFIMQTEGSKRWRLYEAMAESDILAMDSSRNFAQHELGRCILDVWLRAGDFLYAPRGVLHQCVASAEDDSLHVTVSSCLSSSWADYLQRLLLIAVERAKAGDAVFRRVLPLGWQRCMGAQHAEVDDERREAFLDHAMQLLERMMTKEGNDELPFDAAADEMALDFMHARIKPHLAPQQAQRTRLPIEPNTHIIGPQTLIRLTQADVMRLTWTGDGGSPRIHHIADNSRAYKAAPLSHIDLHPAQVPAIETIIAAYPRWLRVRDLPYVSPEEEGEEEENEEAEETAVVEEDAEDREGVVADDDGLESDVRLSEMRHLCEVLCESGILDVMNHGDEEDEDDVVQEEK